MNVTFSSSAPSGAFRGISNDLHVSTEAAGLVTTLFLLGYCAGPLFWAPLSEFYGRRWIFYISFTIYFTFGFLCASTPNFAGLLIGRFLTGTAVSAALTNAPGILADIWGPVERGNAMILFATMRFVGPALEPVVSATELLLITLPETLPMMALRNKARRLREIPGKENVKAPVETLDRSLGGIFSVALTRPWRLLIDPISFFIAIYYAVVYTLLYMLFSIYPIVFQQKRGWNAGVGELPLIGTVIGACLGGLALFINSQIYQRKLTKSYKSVPEDRLPGSIVGGVFHWAVPTVAGTFLATSILLIFVVSINYIIDSYLMYAASAAAANTILRSVCAVASPLFTQYMFDALGVGGAGWLIGALAVLLIPIPFVFYKYGADIRARSNFASIDQTPLPPADGENAVNGRSPSQTSEKVNNG
ncbi:hypothetical protein CBS147332_7954 [Penicillium roqueforti]|nr:hypothetical protein CBS147332_7954 [Penicillium roqueforti]KAI3105319.1 hypothetical protein CBS147331_7010 [Penicillium roqueforti]